MKTLSIPAVCSMRGCLEPAIAAMKILPSGFSSVCWISQCLRHSKGHGKIDLEKIVISSYRSNAPPLTRASA